ncbi:hypothetical protein Javan249_0008 [Streptococcus phage Javan249]|nr:hypothetical protein Javan249_0008 [Streptococcus phage Javan249]
MRPNRWPYSKKRPVFKPAVLNSSNVKSKITFKNNTVIIEAQSITGV